jgi:hypothetical protein
MIRAAPPISPKWWSSIDAADIGVASRQPGDYGVWRCGKNKRQIRQEIRSRKYLLTAVPAFLRAFHRKDISTRAYSFSQPFEKFDPGFLEDL